MNLRYRIARDVILKATPAVMRLDVTFTLDSTLKELRRRGPKHADPTILMHVVGE